MDISTKNEQLILAKERLSKRELTPITEDNKYEYYKHTYDSINSNRLDFSKLKFSGRYLSTEEALRDVEPYFEESDWDLITNIFQNAIKRKGLTKEEVKEISDRILDEK